MKKVALIAKKQGWRLWTVDGVHQLYDCFGCFCWWYTVTTDKGEFAVVNLRSTSVLLPIETDEDGERETLPLAA